MQVRLKRPRLGDVARVRDCEIYLHLPEGLPDGSEVVVVGFESGRYIVQAQEREWNIPMQCLAHEEERCLNGVWLDQWDRRVQKAQRLIDRIHEQERAKAIAASQMR